MLPKITWIGVQMTVLSACFIVIKVKSGKIKKGKIEVLNENLNAVIIFERNYNF